MKNYVYLIVAVLMLFSCKSKQRVITSKSPSKKYTTKKTIPVLEKKTKPNESEEVAITSSATDKVIRKALSFKGTKYKYGGTSKSGMDCSGLMFTSFKTANISLPRTSIAQSKKGVRISKSKAQKGDLVFFKTSAKNRINHVGLVVSVDDRNVKFVHASSSRGVMISSLREGYWANAFSEVRRLEVVNKVIADKPSSSSTTSVRRYTVKKGDTLYAIARKYAGVTAANIMSFNKLSSTSLNPGMVLKIPSGI